MSPVDAFELLFFAVFGMATHTDLKKADDHPPWTVYLFKAVFGVYMLVSVVVLINLLIAMMSDTYQRIQVNLLHIHVIFFKSRYYYFNYWTNYNYNLYFFLIRHNLI